MTRRSKFAGCLLGALVGDCYGYQVEGLAKPMTKQDLKIYFNNMHERARDFKLKLSYSDDTAMTRSLVESFAQASKVSDRQIPFNACFLAERFATSFQRNPNRGYGGAVAKIFEQWIDLMAEGVLNSATVFDAAKEQFDGRGSFGNGGAMRVAPVAMRFVDDYDNMIEVAKDSAQLTHTHDEGVAGCVCQCIAVWLALNADGSKALDPEAFLEQLGTKILKFEVDNCQTPVYADRLKCIGDLLKNQGRLKKSQVVETLGNDVSALRSVPTAIYMALRAITSDSKQLFENLILDCLTLGGDTDTIASMAGAITGAFFGEGKIPDEMTRVCESFEVAIDQAIILQELSEDSPAPSSNS